MRGNLGVWIFKYSGKGRHCYKRILWGYIVVELFSLRGTCIHQKLLFLLVAKICALFSNETVVCWAIDNRFRNGINI